METSVRKNFKRHFGKAILVCLGKNYILAK
jgi:hypothetical protein